MEIEKTNTSNNCKMNYKSILTTVAITLLTSSSFYLFIRHTSQKEVIKEQANYINELKANLTQNNAVSHIDNYFNRLLNNNTWLSFRNPFSDMEDIISRSWDKVSSNQEVKSYYDHISIKATESEYTITFVLPGFSKEEILIELLGNMLKVTAKNIILDQNNIEADPDRKNQQLANESKQSIKVPSDIDQDNISATLNNGLLTITMPRIQDKTNKDKEPKKILISKVSAKWFFISNIKNDTPRSRVTRYLA